MVRSRLAGSGPPPTARLPVTNRAKRQLELPHELLFSGYSISQRLGAGLPGSPSAANSSLAGAVDLRASLFLRRRPAFSCLFLRFTLVAAVFDAMADPSVKTGVSSAI